MTPVDPVPDTVLVIAPHPDDEVLGCGGTIAAWSAAGATVVVLTVCSDLPPLYREGLAAEIEAEAREAHRVLGVAHSEFLDLPSVEVARLPVAELNGGVERCARELRPDVVLAPFPDRHVDHRAVFDAAMVAARPVGPGTDIGLVALYETVSETFWNAPGAEPTFAPTWFVDIGDTLRAKLDAFACFRSQLQEHPGPRTLEALEALAVFRGSQQSMRAAEAFQVVRMSTRGRWPRR
ncbi:PIG-L deacetylase family protein [Brevibacterium ihuae]|uniref:PIG-L deacetylase family protein n=1 Tax=Brevibacterium ihuae TaxID=1631743 RepID=UPI000C773A3C|nr:PIG-L deacetylase family protein [Brevibacterium ihuae]